MIPGKGVGEKPAWAGAYVVLTALAALVAAVAIFLYISGRPPGNSSAEAGFARDMAVHHAQAVEMAFIAERRTEDEEVRTLASDIVLTQQAQIGQMQGWLSVWGLPQTGSEPQMAWMEHEMQPGDLMPGMATREEVATLSELEPDEMNAEFLRLMIEHHGAAIPMSDAVLAETDRPEVESFAGAVSSSQQKEIAIMQDMLRGMGEEPAPMQEAMPGMEM
ncbi:DUF305 domain-containing protein [Rubrobacter indicoceani]|uniref:DUF305 domain-containing protein n=1 Tax=Rubrobacter indicoceani TaxID=2051957 RepID=UPI000E5C4AE9|nr:DUF305 domain-containing protein [Rubrobacter indicoceani]